jgi:hypothetical protein
VFFKSKITADDFAKCLLREHHAIFGPSSLDQICKQLDFHFRDEPSYIEAFYEFQAFGIYSIASGVRTQCSPDLRAAILSSWYAIFKDISGPNWEIMRHRVAEYENLHWQAPTGGLAASRIFDRPLGSLQPTSKNAFGLTMAMNASHIDALEAVERLFKEYKVDV